MTGYWRGDHSEAVATLESALRVAESEGNKLGQSYAMGYLALARTALGDLEDANARSSAAITLSEAGGFSEHFVAMIGHLAAGRLQGGRGEMESAEDTLSRALALARRGAGALELAAALIALAQVRQSRGDRAGAGALLVDAREIVDNCSDPGDLARSLVVAEGGLRARSRGPRRAIAERDELTDREIAVLRLLAGELSRREIADALYVSLDTVKTHIRGIYRKLGASTREDAVAGARRRGLI